MAAGDITSESRRILNLGSIRMETLEIVTNGTGAVTFTSGLQRPLFGFANFTEAPDTTSSLFVAVSGLTVTIDGSAASGTKKAVVCVFGY